VSFLFPEAIGSVPVVFLLIDIECLKREEQLKRFLLKCLLNYIAGT